VKIVNHSYKIKTTNYKLTVFVPLSGSNRPGSAFSSFHCMFPEQMSVKIEMELEKKSENTQSSQIFFGETILLISPFMKVHTTMVTAWNAAKKGHTILCSTIAGPHYISAPSWRLGAINSSNCTGCVFASMVGYIQPNNRNTTTRRVALY
jgi:hypothetical protein